MSTDATSTPSLPDPYSTPGAGDFIPPPPAAPAVADGAVPQPAGYPAQAQPGPPPPGYAQPPYGADPNAMAAYPQQGYAQPGYPPPGYAQPYYPGYPDYGYRDPRATSKNWMNILALVMSLASLATGFTAILGIIFGHLGVKAAREGEADNGGIGKAGLILGYVFLGLGVLFWVIYFIFIIWIVSSDSSY